MNTDERFEGRLNRYITAMRNEKADMVPIRPFVAEFTAKYAGYTCQEVAHDYTKAFEAAIKTAKDFDWDDRQKITGMKGRPQPRVRPGVCFPWEDRVKDLPEITGSPELIRKIWEDIDAFGNMYIWQLLLSF